MTNILRPNLYGIGTSQSPEWVISKGTVAKVTDASGGQLIVIAQGGKLDLDGAVGENVIVMDGVLSSQVSVYRAGTEARFRWTATGETILSIPVTTAAQTIRFADEDRILQIVRTTGKPPEVQFGGSPIPSDSVAPILDSVSLVGTELRLGFSEELSGSAGGLPAAESLKISLDGTELQPSQVQVVGVEGSTLRINLPAVAAAASDVVVSYADPTPGTGVEANDQRAIQDINGNDATSFGPVSADLNPADQQAPRLRAAATDATGSRITLEFDEALNPVTALPDSFSVEAGGSDIPVLSVMATC